MTLPPLSTCQQEGYALMMYYRGLKLPEKRATHLAAEYVVRRLLFRQDGIIEEVIKCKNKS